METLTVIMLLGFVVGFGTGIMVLHVLAVLRDRRDARRIQPILDNLYPFLRESDMEPTVIAPIKK
jgi:hypothetical protein